MSNDKIRAALAAAGVNGLAPDELREKAGALPQGRPARDIELRDGRYYLVPDASPRVAKKKSAKKQRNAHGPAREGKTVKDLVRTVRSAPDRTAVTSLVIDGYTTSVQTLRTYLLEHVDGLDGDAVLQSLIKQTEANEKIVLAGRAA